MIDPSLIGRTTRWTVVASLLLAAMAFAGGRFDAGLGILAGAVLGLVPVLSWAWAIAPLMRGRNGWLVAALMLGKVIFYGAALYALVWSQAVHVPSMAVAILVPHGVLAAAALTARPAEAKA
jgi:hypothetical protein